MLLAPPPPVTEAVAVAVLIAPVADALLFELLTEAELFDEAELVVDGTPVAEAVAEFEVGPPIEVDPIVCVPPAPPLPGSAGASLSGEEHAVREMSRKQ